MTLNEMSRAAHDNSVAKGFWTQENQTQNQTPPILLGGHTAETLLAKLALIHSEVSEAAEYVRKPICDVETSTEVTVNLDPLAEELADIIIRVGDLAGELGLDLDAAVASKMAANRERPYRHGKLA